MQSLRDRLTVRRVIVKAANWGAKSGEVIRGNLRRGQGGRFGSGGSSKTPQADRLAAQARSDTQAQIDQNKPAARLKRGGGRSRKPRETPEARQAARDQAKAEKLQANQQAVTEALTGADYLGPTGVKAILSAASGTPLDATLGPDLEKLGYAVKNPDGSYRLSPEGKAVASAAKRGDVEAAMSAAGKAQERAKAFAESSKGAAAKSGGGGGGGKKELSDAEKAEAKDQAKLQTAAETSAKLGLPDGISEVLAAAAAGRPANVDPSVYPQLANQLLQLGFTTEADETEATDAGRRALTSLLRGDEVGYRAAVQDAREKAQREFDKQSKTLSSAIDQETAQREAEDEKAQRDFDRQIRYQTQQQAKSDRAQRMATAQQKRQVEVQTQKAERDRRTRDRDRRRKLNRVEKSHMVIKQGRDGRWRWLMTSTTAYEDQDRETVTKSAIQADVAYADLTGEYGPLLWWHTRYRLGDCDFNMAAGPLLIESGTFRNGYIAKAVSRSVNKLGVSIGFLPLPWEQNGPVFNFIRRKERSLLPRSYASNLFTRLTVYKEKNLMDDETKLKIKQLADLLNLSEADALEMVNKEVARVKTQAGAAGLVEKAANPFAKKDGDAIAEVPAGETPVVEAKATDAGVDPAVDADVEAGLADGGTGGMDLGDDLGGSLFSPAEMQEIAGAIAPMVAAAVVDALMPQLNLEQRMAKMADEIKGLVAPKPAAPPVGGPPMPGAKSAAPAGPSLVTKDTEPDLIAKLADLEQQILILKGDQPTVHRPSVLGETLVADVIRSMMASRDLRVKGLGLGGAPVAHGNVLDSFIDDMIPGGNTPAV